MSTHTPGPWEMTPVYPGNPPYTVYSPNGNLGVAANISFRNDARLIAAAPDLLKLLKQAEAIMSQLDKPRVGRFWLPNFLAGARYTIALAEEGSNEAP